MMAFINKNKPTDTSGHIPDITKIKIHSMDLSELVGVLKNLNIYFSIFQIKYRNII